ncbi:hypothetical protein BH11ACT3_BH11ACT3_20090 [soil metagenome]
MQHTDGNALAGRLAGLFTFDPTTASIRCDGCGTAAALATDLLYDDDMGAVLRCGSCDSVLMTIVESDDGVCLGLSGVRSIEVRGLDRSAG